MTNSIDASLESIIENTLNLVLANDCDARRRWWNDTLSDKDRAKRLIAEQSHIDLEFGHMAMGL
jgi:hypothetical protein